MLDNIPSDDFFINVNIPSDVLIFFMFVNIPSDVLIKVFINFKYFVNLFLISFL